MERSSVNLAGDNGNKAPSAVVAMVTHARLDSCHSRSASASADNVNPAPTGDNIKMNVEQIG
jgi:hypothetical protein